VWSAHGRFQKRNRIYHRVFDRRGGQSNLPDADVRRQPAAFWLGVLRTSGIAVAVVVAFVVMLAITITRTKAGHVAQAEPLQPSGSRGQRRDSLSGIAKANWVFSRKAHKARLRDLAAKSLALMDLKDGSELSVRLADAAPFTLSPDFGLCAQG